MRPLSKEHCLKHYNWGDNCDGWSFVSGPGVIVKQEKMPSGIAEKLYIHSIAQQFFFILNGEAEFSIEDNLVTVPANQGLKIEPGKKHKIMNKTPKDLEFLLISFPSTENDKTDCE